VKSERNAAAANCGIAATNRKHIPITIVLKVPVIFEFLLASITSPLKNAVNNKSKAKGAPEAQSPSGKYLWATLVDSNVKFAIHN
jgi:hypothetical protein